MRFQWFPILGEALPTHTLKKIATSLIHCHVSTTVLNLLQGIINILAKSYNLSKRHWVAAGLGRFQKVHASGDDYDLHVSQGLLGDLDLILQLRLAKDKGDPSARDPTLWLTLQYR